MLIRSKQPILTRVTPHNANRRAIIPNRVPGGANPTPPTPPASGIIGIAEDTTGQNSYGYGVPVPPQSFAPWGSIDNDQLLGVTITTFTARLSNADTESVIFIKLSDDLPPILGNVLLNWGTKSVELFVGSDNLSRTIKNPEFAQYIKDNEGNDLPFSFVFNRSLNPVFLTDENNVYLETENGALIYKD